jgi:hypothetical protein
MTRSFGSADDREVTVCAACFRACCWQGVFYCDDYKSASTTTRTVRQLRELALEHSDYWRPQP